MDIYINDNLTKVSQNSNINSLLKELNIENPQGIAIALNNKVVPKNQWESETLKEDDKVLLIRASQGG